MNYASTDEINKKNYKGLLSTDENNRVLRPKMAYEAVRNLVSVYDNLSVACDSSAVKVYADSAMVYLFLDEVTGLNSAVIWRAGAAPTDKCDKTPVKVAIEGFCGRKPVCVDLLTGHVYRPRVRCCSGTTILKNVPFFDSPVIICDESQVSMATASAGLVE